METGRQTSTLLLVSFVAREWKTMPEQKTMWIVAARVSTTPCCTKRKFSPAKRWLSMGTCLKPSCKLCRSLSKLLPRSIHLLCVTKRLRPLWSTKLLLNKLVLLEMRCLIVVSGWTKPQTIWQVQKSIGRDCWRLTGSTWHKVFDARTISNLYLPRQSIDTEFLLQKYLYLPYWQYGAKWGGVLRPNHLVIQMERTGSNPGQIFDIIYI
jgi:hypothetical protein